MSNHENFIQSIKKNKIVNNAKIDFSIPKYAFNKHNQLINIIKLGYNEFSPSKISIFKESASLVQGNSFNYIPIQIRKIINVQFSKNYQFTFKIDNRIFNVFISTDNTSNNINKNIIIKIYNILFFFNYLSKSKLCNQILNIYIYFTNIKKNLPQNFEVLDRQHINTAFTKTCEKVGEIYIYRYEEWIKSLIHECMHSFGFDFSQNFSKSNDIYASKILQKYLPINFDISLYESYVDIMAIYINTLFVSFYTSNNKDADNFNAKVIKKANNLFINELYFSLFQTIKILDYYDIKYSEIAYNNKIVLHKYDENTPVFSYFIIKSILFFHFQNLFSWCIKNNSNVIDFECNNKIKNSLSCNKKIKSFCYFVIKHYNNPNFISDMENMHKYYKNIKNNNDIFKTLKFTLYG